MSDDFEIKPLQSRLREKLQNAVSDKSLKKPVFGKMDFGVIEECAAFLRSVDEGLGAGKGKSYFLGLCDDIRDDKLVAFGIKLEDVVTSEKTAKSVWKRVDAEALSKARNERREIESKNAILRVILGNFKISKKRKL